jgi:hypothetical protein
MGERGVYVLRSFCTNAYERPQYRSRKAFLEEDAAEEIAQAKEDEDHHRHDGGYETHHLQQL